MRNEIRVLGCYKVVLELRLTELKADLKDYKGLKTKTKTGRLRDRLESECSTGQGLHVFAYSIK